MKPRKKEYRHAVLTILAAIMSGSKQASWNGRSCVKPEEFVHCAKEFADELFEQTK